jgi:muramoyltetrapeptide carboxypeptidase
MGLPPHLDVELVRRTNKWLVGFSDVTALHALWARAGLCSIHGPMVSSLLEAYSTSRMRKGPIGNGPTWCACFP